MRNFLLTAATLCLSAALPRAEGPAIKVNGKAWTEFGRIMGATDSLLPGEAPTPILNLNGNGIVSLGAQFTLNADLTNNLEAALGFGSHKVNHALGRGQTSYLSISMFHNYLTESRLSWYMGEKEAPSLKITVGSFPYKYNRDVRNLGLYLFRGSVYPGILMGGFGDFAADTTKSTQLGANVHHAMGNFSHDIILNSERDLPPTFDWSLGYVAKYKAFNALEIGAGVNFYRLIAYDEELRTPGKIATADLGGPAQKAKYIEVDSTNPAAPDTVFFTHQGTKVMAMASLDLKPLFGIESNSDAWKIYSEVAVIGTQDYGKTYGKIGERIPIMFGVNFPTPSWLDHINFEVEHYGSPYRNDLARLGNNNVVADWTIQGHPIPSPKPVSNADFNIDAAGNWTDVNTGNVIAVKGTALDKESNTLDNLKWSLYLDKTVAGHITFMGQLANDHYRPRPVATGLISSNGGTAEAFADKTTFGAPSKWYKPWTVIKGDWYYMFRMGYSF